MALCLASLAACGGDYPWVDSEGKAPGASPTATVVAGEGGQASAQSSAPAGGLHARCRQGLVPSGDPTRDVMRLAISCGPAGGMRRVGDGPTEGALAAGTASVTLPFELETGVCYRVFAAADATVSELSVEIRSAQGTLIASDTDTGSVAVAQSDRPFCALQTETASLTVRAEAGRGAFALEVWTDRAK